jgi:hypothetical protein
MLSRLCLELRLEEHDSPDRAKRDLICGMTLVTEMKKDPWR